MPLTYIFLALAQVFFYVARGRFIQEGDSVKNVASLTLKDC